MKEIIEIAEHLHIGVHVDATLGIKRVGAHPVGREGILAVVERLAYPVGTVAAQTLEIPQTQFIVWKCLFQESMQRCILGGNGSSLSQQ